MFSVRMQVVTNLSGSVTSQVATLTITPFNSIYCFGFSWTDTHNCGSDFTSPDYYTGHFHPQTGVPAAARRRE